MIQLAWPATSRDRRSVNGSPGAARGRVRRIAIVARKLLVALWRYVGVIPEGAVLKA
jgi:hypothetical protein